MSAVLKEFSPNSMYTSTKLCDLCTITAYTNENVSIDSPINH